MVEILCTLTGVVSGITVVAALMRHQADRNRVRRAEEPALLDEAESLKGITTQLQLLTNQVAADVSAHSEKVVHINQRLLPAENEPERILSAISELIQANEAMQGQLAAAQQLLNTQSEQIEATSRQARTDALTGLANRRALEESLKNCIDSVGKTQTTGLMLIDIDFFKSFNDAYGHITGDAVLASFAQNLAKWCNGNYYTARYGGEEFAIILSSNSGPALAQLAAEARAYISEQVINHEDLRLAITASAGLTIIQEGDTLKQVYERADEGLYRSKKSGRDRGFWLDSGEWGPFPAVNIPVKVAANLATSNAEKVFQHKHVRATLECFTVPPIDTLDCPDATQSGIDDEGLLALNPFVERLETQLKQLHRAEMPATVIMLEAVDLTPDTVQDFHRSWLDVLDIVQANLRGIDVICRLRQNALCIFMPGCALEASLERAGAMQSLLEERRQSSPPNHYPKRFAIAIAGARYNEEVGTFLQRLEDALDDAQDALPLELVVSDTMSSYFHAI